MLFTNGDIRSCDDEDDATCQDLRNLRDVLGCCAASFVEYGTLHKNMIIVISQPRSDGDEPGSDGGPTIEGPTDGGPTDGGSGEPDSGLSACYSSLSCNSKIEVMKVSP